MENFIMIIQNKKAIAILLGLVISLKVAAFPKKPQNIIKMPIAITTAGALYGGLLVGMTNGIFASSVLGAGSVNTLRAVNAGARTGALLGGLVGAGVTVPPAALIGAYFCAKQTVQHLQKIQPDSSQADKLQKQIFLNNDLFQ